MTRVVFDPGSPDVPSDSMHPLAERAFEIMDAAGIEQELIDEICEGIDELAGQANAECPACERRAAELEQQSWEAFKNDPNAEDKLMPPNAPAKGQAAPKHNERGLKP